MTPNQEYLENRVATASPQQLHLMVVDGAIRHARRAQEALKAGEVETAHTALGASREFVCELLSGLNFDADAQLAEQVKQLFLFVYRRLVEAESDRNPEAVADALRVLEVHRETWLELIEQLKTQSHHSDVAAPPDSPPRPHIRLADIDDDWSTSNSDTSRSWTT